MAFSFFSGKKDKNPPEAAAPVAKAPPTPPKIQNPPGAPASAPTVPAVKPPQPAGLIPATGKHAGAATTQPMVMPRAAGGGLKPARPGVAQSARSTQRIVLPGAAAGGKPTATKPVAMSNVTGRINLPIGMILRCLPQEVLAADLSEFEASGAAATEVGLPMNLILGQLPSGKIEIALSDLIPHFPAGYLQPTQSITSYLPNLINLPLMDVVMRIPPDAMQLRADQKDVDAAVINMADPFTEEILREQAEAARRQQAEAQANAAAQSQAAPAEAVAPREQAPAAGPKTIAPPPRPKMPSVSSPGAAPAATPPPPPMPISTLAPAPAVPASPSTSARTISPSGSGRLPAPTPTRATAAIPTRIPAAVTSPIDPAPSTLSAPKRQTASVPAPPVPPVPRQTTSLPVSTLPRQTAFPPQPSRPPVAPPTVPVVPPAPPVAAAPEPEPEPAPEEPPVVAPAPASGGADDLQRLAALAMAELGDDGESEPEPKVDSESATIALPAEELPVPEAVPEPAPEPVAEETVVAPSAVETAPLPIPEVAPEPEPEPVAVAPEPEPEPVAVAPEPEPEPVAIAPEPEPEPVAPEPVAPPVPVLVEAPKVDLPPVSAPKPPAGIKAVTPPVPVAAPAPEPEAKPEPEPAPAEAAAAPAGVAFNLNTCTAADLVQHIPGCFPELAESIVRHREKIGSFRRLEDLLEVPGITKAAYTNLTGEAPPDNRIPLSLNELLGFPADQEISLKDVTDRISCWPDVTGCILSQSSGLPLVGTVPEGLNMNAIVAFAPRMFEALNKSFVEITGRETDDLIIPVPGNSFHIFRNRDLYLIILSRLPQMPERHMKVARFVLAALSIRRD